MSGSQVRLLRATFFTLSRLSDARKIALNVVGSLLSNEQIRCVRVDNSAIELHNIVADFSLSHFASDWVARFLGMQLSLSYLIEIGLDDFSGHGRLVCVVNEVFKSLFRWLIIWHSLILGVQFLCNTWTSWRLLKEWLCAIQDRLGYWVVGKLRQCNVCG